MRRRSLVGAFVLLLVAGAVEASGEGSPPVELGAVAWHRDFDVAVEAAREQERDLLLLFQEVPG